MVSSAALVVLQRAKGETRRLFMIQHRVSAAPTLWGGVIEGCGRARDVLGHCPLVCGSLDERHLL
jgi:hypothetical protein